MKKNLLMLALCFTATFAFAQKITNKDLQGHWNMVSFSTQGVQYEIATGQVDIPADMKAQVDAQTLESIKGGMKQAAEQFKGAYADFDGASIKMGMAASSETNLYTLTEKEGKQYLTLKQKDGSTREMPVVYKDKRLYITVEPAQSFNMIFTKG